MVWLFRVASAWCVGGHVLAVAFSAGVAAVNIYLLATPFVGSAMTQLDATVERYYLPMAVSASISAIGHTLLAAYTSTDRWRCARRADIQVRPLTVSATTSHKRVGGPSSALTRPISANSTRAQLARYSTQFWDAWKKYNSEMTRLLMLCEVALQTFQANKISRLIASKGINRLVTLVIVMNCWFAPVLQYVMRKKPSRFVRLCRLLIDSWLDTIYGIAIPLTIFYPYYRDFQGEPTLFPRLHFFMDTWYINAISELRQVFVTSWLDYVSKVTASFALMYRLYVVSHAVTAARDEASKPHEPHEVYRRSRATKVLDVTLLLWGAGIVMLHLHATVISIVHHDSGCLLELRPWASTEYTCAALEISCRARAHAGEQAAVQHAIEAVDPASIQILILSHCEALEMPPAIQTLRNLLTVKIYNSTIAVWEEDAALSGSLHPTLQSVFLPRINMSKLPHGLLAPDFPSTVWSVILSQTNLTNFADSLSLPWHGVIIFVVEASPGVTEVPRAVCDLPRLLNLEWRFNTIVAMPDPLPMQTFATIVGLHGNPIDRLPDSLQGFPLLRELDVSSTRVSEIPASWMDDTTAMATAGRTVRLKAAGSPLCERIRADRGALGNRAVPSWLDISCLVDEGSEEYFYPLVYEDAWRNPR